MLASELYDAFRSDVVDIAKPYLWSDDEVWRYMNDAYRMFVRFTGGIPDSTSALTQVPIVANQATSEVSPLILKYRTAVLQSNGRFLTILSDVEEPRFNSVDYNNFRAGMRDNTPGIVQYMMTGIDRNARRGLVRWVRIPQYDDTCQLNVYRLPLDTITENTPDFDLYEIGEEHHEHLLLWMKHRAYGKQDAETFDRGRSDSYLMAFKSYCDTAQAEWNRYKHQNNAIAYGGI